MPNLIRRQPEDLPQREETWHAFLFKIRTWVAEKDNKPMRPHGLMILDLGTGVMMGVEMIGTPTPEWVGEMVMKAITEPAKGSQPYRPQMITFADDSLVNALTPRLAEIGVACSQLDTPEDLYRIVDELTKFLRKDAPIEIPGLLSVPDVTPELVGELFAAATEFYRAAPWVRLYNVQGLAVRLSTQAEPWYVSVMGNAGIEYGLSVSMTWDDFKQMVSGPSSPQDVMPAGGGHSMLFNHMTEVPFDDLDAIERYGWSVPDENTIPFPMVFDRKANVARPDRTELLWYQAALRAIPIFVREHLHPDTQGDYAPAEASIPVPTSDGEVTVIIRYPAGELDRAAEPTVSLDWFEEDSKDEGPQLRFDRRMMEGQMAAMGLRAGAQSFFADPKMQEAQEVMYQAWETQNPGRRIALAHKALSISPDCADAYVLLAEEEADTVGRALDFYKQGVEAGERALSQRWDELVGNFWSVIETRPYMRARHGLADTLWRLGRREEAASHLQEMLRLNPSDNQGVRYLLVDLLFQLDRDAEVLELLGKYRGDWSATWHYTRALLEFRHGGATAKANKALKSALRQNPHVPPYLTGQKRVPNRLPDYIGMGDENEAVAYAADHLNHWRRTEGAVNWLKEQLAAKPAASKPGPKKTREPSWDDVFDALLAEATGPATVDELVKQALTRKSSRAKNPAKAVETHLRDPYAHKSYVFVDRDHVVPVRRALQGVRFRITLDRQMVSSGAIPLDPHFYPFLRNLRLADSEPVTPSFENERGLEIPVELTTQHVKPVGPLSELKGHQAQVVDLKAWLSSLHARRGDSLLLTILDWEKGRFQLAFEPERRRRKDEIAQQNRTLADLIYELLEATFDERILTERAVVTAYARLASARDYPGDHWTTVLEKDERLRWDDWQILHAESDHLSLSDMFEEEPEEEVVEEKPFTAKQGKQVYRFRAVRGKKEFIIEAQGANTLGDLDAVMKDAFKLDTWDHLSEFTLVTPRGKGKQPRLKHFGAMDPLGEYAAHRVRIAGLGLQTGAQLEYVYDFGDNIEHALVLEAIEEPEGGAEYPRFRKVSGAKRK